MYSLCVFITFLPVASEMWCLAQLLPLMIGHLSQKMTDTGNCFSFSEQSWIEED